MKWWVRLTMYWYVPQFAIRNPERQGSAGPTLLLANHPDSFLDALLIALACNRPVHFLARGDVFNRPWHRTLLRLLNMYPVYRIREGRQYVHLNRTTFQYAHEVLSNGGTLLIFIEGICLNTHALQPFKKGAGRIAIEASSLPDFRIIPVGVAYSDFQRIGKAATLCFGEALLPGELFTSTHEQSNIHQFNSILFLQLKELIQPPTTTISDKHLGILAIVTPLAKCMNFPLFYPVSRWVGAKTKGTVFYDSVLFAVLLFTYPLYCILIASLLKWMGVSWLAACIFTAMAPASAYYVLSARLQLNYKSQAVPS